MLSAALVRACFLQFEEKERAGLLGVDGEVPLRQRLRQTVMQFPEAWQPANLGGLHHKL